MNIEPLDSSHARGAFRSGVAALDTYFRGQAGRDAVRRMAAVFVLVQPDRKVIGYYTLAPATLLLPDLLLGAVHKESRYPAMPAIRLSRLAVDERRRRRGHGRLLLADALRRAGTSPFKPVALIAESPDEAGQGFYAREGFLSFPDRADRLFRPVADFAPLVAAAA